MILASFCQATIFVGAPDQGRCATLCYRFAGA